MKSFKEIQKQNSITIEKEKYLITPRTRRQEYFSGVKLWNIDEITNEIFFRKNGYYGKPSNALPIYYLYAKYSKERTHPSDMVYKIYASYAPVFQKGILESRNIFAYIKRIVSNLNTYTRKHGYRIQAPEKIKKNIPDNILSIIDREGK